MAGQECRGLLVDCNYREMPVLLSPFLFPPPAGLPWFTFPILYELQPMVVHQAMWYQKAQGCHCY